MSISTKITIILIGLAVLMVVAIVGLTHYGNQYIEHEYQLYEMNDGVYAIYYTTHSRVPAHNYEVVIVCCNGNVNTFKGNVNISFINGEPHIKVRAYNTINSDDIYIYVPRGTVSYQPSIDIGR